MNISKKFLPVAAIACLAFTGTVQTAQADSFHKSRTAHTLYGLGAGLVIGYGIGSHHGHHRSSHHYSYSHGPSYRYSYSSGYGCSTSSYRPYRSSYTTYSYHQPTRVYYHEPVRERVVYQPAPQPVYVAPADDSYYSYKEKRVWPFYKSVDVERIPQLPPVQPANSQTLSNTEYSRLLRRESRSDLYDSGSQTVANATVPNVQIIQNFNGVDPSQVETRVEGGNATTQKNLQTPESAPSQSKAPAVTEIPTSYQSVSFHQSSSTQRQTIVDPGETITVLPSRTAQTTPSKAVPNRSSQPVPSRVNEVNSVGIEI